MGEVFRATDELLGRPVAVKLLLPTDRDPRAAERFQREARAAAMLNDTHLVAVYDFGSHGDQFFLVMELVEGRTVADELAAHGPLPKDRAIDIVEQSAAGLAAAHRLDVVHRDVKPGNLLLAGDGTVKVADFGIAHLPGEGATTLTAAGQIIGSTHYLAPERAKGGRAGKESDVYALGCVLYQLVTGQPPFTAEHPTAILYKHVDTPPVPPSASRPELSGPFESVLLRMLAKNPADRPTAAEIAAGSLRTGPVTAWPLAAAPAAGVAGQAAAAGVAGQAAAAGVAGQAAAVGGVAGQAAATPAAGDSPADSTTAAATAVPAGAAAADAGAGAGQTVATSALPAEQGPSRTRKTLLAGGIALAATAAAVVGGILLNGNDPKLPATTDVGPQPGVVTPATPGTTTTNPSTTGPTQPGAVDPATQTAQPSQSASQSASPTPSTPPSSTPPTSTPSQNAPSPSAPATSTSTSSTPTKSTPPTDPPSSTPPTDGPSTSTPSTGTPSPDTQSKGSPTPRD
ncbi:hypothetical protein GCM10009789_08770 [Kribbella sancticallisti]|uniref:non-specific serine/threonine protein kinase n=2 Tax=Kribbella sancticallisti TaxID=460087 RepID=A0ABN2CF81_9ACTN